MRSLEDVEHVALERSAVPRPPDAGAQLVRHDRAEVLEGREQPMKGLQGLVGGSVSKGADEELRVENTVGSGRAGVGVWTSDNVV